ncbi:MAG: hypothetical protein R3C02_01845 [Planctomycetaceae bacterium]
MLLEQFGQSLVQLRLVLFDGHHVVRLGLDDRPGRLDLRVHGIQRDDGAPSSSSNVSSTGTAGISFLLVH